MHPIASAQASPRPPEHRDIAGLCKAATIEAIEAQGWSLNPGRSVGVAAGEELSDEEFKAALEALNEELAGWGAQARGLEATFKPERGGGSPLMNSGTIQELTATFTADAQPSETGTPVLARP